jgi:hypothetical protein
MSPKELYLAAAEIMDDPNHARYGACAAITDAAEYAGILGPTQFPQDEPRVWPVLHGYQEAFDPGFSPVYYFGGGKPQYLIGDHEKEREAREARVYSLLLAAEALT